MAFNVDPLNAILKSLEALRDQAEKIKKAQLDKRALCYALLQELKHNERMCVLVLEFNLPIEEVINKFSREVFDEICASGIKLSSIKRRKITNYKRLENKALASWGDKKTAELLMKTYDKITELVTFYPHAKEGKVRPEMRLDYIGDRIKLLLMTINCDL